MGVRNCRKCGRVFNYFSGLPICAACKEGMEKKFQDVKKFIRENPHADMKEIAESCEVEVQQIHQWVREERLEFTEDSPIKLPCESCGTIVTLPKINDEKIARMYDRANHFRKVGDFGGLRESSFP